MTAKLFTGTVKSVKLEEREPYGNQYKYQWKDAPELTLKVELELNDGTMAYFNTPPAKTDYCSKNSRNTWKFSSPKNGYTWYHNTREDGRHYYRSHKLYAYPIIEPVIEEGDTITVSSGSYSKRTSRVGNEYYQLKRVALKNIVD